MLCPSIEAATFFVYDGGKFENIHEIALASALISMMSIRSRSATEAERPIQPVPAHSIPILSLASEEDFRPTARNRWIVPAAAAIVGFGLGLATLLLFAGGRSTSEPVKAVAARAPQIQQSAPGLPVQTLRLKAMREGEFLRLSWTPPPAVSRAILHIQDGPQQIDKILTPGDFNSGTFVYQANTQEVTFQMDVYSGPSSKGAIQVLNIHAPADAVKPFVSPEGFAPANPTVEAKPLPPMPPHDLLATVEEPLPSKSPALSPAPANEPPRAAESFLARAESVPARRAPSADVPSVHAPSVHVYAEPLGSRMEDVVGKIAFFRKGKKRTSPVVLHSEPPVLDGPAVAPLTEAVLVKVKVWLKPSGTVDRAEIVNFGEPPNFPLAHASIAAARNWTFEAASLDGNSGPSEMLLNFRFAP